MMLYADKLVNVGVGEVLEGWGGGGAESASVQLFVGLSDFCSACWPVFGGTAAMSEVGFSGVCADYEAGLVGVEDFYK
uniref:Uncharacterized protein n=1 Tax=Medicago truncatula TaxID=3880 RepID=A2Q2N4_MEDTR|nr:hypothetical protein MtrDRAFT_AC151521g57v2 [Medicago truncatula]